MKKLGLIGVIFGLLTLNMVRANKLKLYHCQSEDGTVMVQDRPCSVTHLKPVKPQSQPQPDRFKKPLDSRKKNTFKTPKQTRLNAAPDVSSQAFIDLVKAKNMSANLTRNSHGWQLLIDIPGPGDNQHAGQISVQYYKNPEATLKINAFSYALNLYHTIRHQYRLTDSQFKSHSAYKIFNMAYHKSNRSAKSEFYISKLDDSLWVFTLESNPADLFRAQKLMDQLQALI